jgi:hypothetical protein
VTEKQKKSIFKRWWFWVIVVIIVIGAIASQGDGDDTPKLSTDQGAKEAVSRSESETEEQAPEFFKLGETVETSKIKATITEMTKPKGDEFNKPEDGNEFVLLKMTIENISEDQELTISSMLSFNAYIDDSALNESFTAHLESDNTMDGTIAPGKKLTGTLGYEVPKDWKEIEIHFEPEVWDDVKIKWIIENQ